MSDEFDDAIDPIATSSVIPASGAAAGGLELRRASAGDGGRRGPPDQAAGA